MAKEIVRCKTQAKRIKMSAWQRDAKRGITQASPLLHVFGGQGAIPYVVRKTGVTDPTRGSDGYIGREILTFLPEEHRKDETSAKGMCVYRLNIP